MVHNSLKTSNSFKYAVCLGVIKSLLFLLGLKTNLPIVFHVFFNILGEIAANAA
jgi:hypothetical protein